jgi:hypothetical protein
MFRNISLNSGISLLLQPNRKIWKIFLRESQDSIVLKYREIKVPLGNKVTVVRSSPTRASPS